MKAIEVERASKFQQHLSKLSPPLCCLVGQPLNHFRVTCNVTDMTLSQRVSDYRSRMRARGFRPVQMWVPDVRTEVFATEAREQSTLVAQARQRTDDQDFIEAVSADWGDE